MVCYENQGVNYDPLTLIKSVSKEQPYFFLYLMWCVTTCVMHLTLKKTSITFANLYKWQDNSNLLIKWNKCAYLHSAVWFLYSISYSVRWLKVPWYFSGCLMEKNAASLCNYNIYQLMSHANQPKLDPLGKMPHFQKIVWYLGLRGFSLLSANQEKHRIWHRLL